jgi:hypothetical protein
MAEHQLPKLNTRVRFPSSAPHPTRAFSPFMWEAERTLRLIACTPILQLLEAECIFGNQMVTAYKFFQPTGSGALIINRKEAVVE